MQLSSIKAIKQSGLSKEKKLSKESDFSSIVEEYQYNCAQKNKEKLKRKRKLSTSPYFDTSLSSSTAAESSPKRQKLEDQIGNSVLNLRNFYGKSC